MDAACARIDQNRAQTARMVQAAIARSQPRQQLVASRKIRLRTAVRYMRAVLLWGVAAGTVLAAFVFVGPLDFVASRLGYSRINATAAPAPTPVGARPVADFSPETPIHLRLESHVDLGAISNQPLLPKDKP